MAIPFLSCMALVASVYSLPPRVLPAIHALEGGVPGSISHNADGSEDLGVMQVNTRWLPPLARVSRLPTEEVRRRLVVEPCFNIAAAGLIMRSYLVETHGDLMRAIGDYHSHTPALNVDYQARVVAAARRMFAPNALRHETPRGGKIVGERRRPHRRFVKLHAAYSSLAVPPAVPPNEIMGRAEV